MLPLTKYSFLLDLKDILEPKVYKESVTKKYRFIPVDKFLRFLYNTVITKLKFRVKKRYIPIRNTICIKKSKPCVEKYKIKFILYPSSF